jgi:predicted DNA-binding transcriptional regulator AlpA
MDVLDLLAHTITYYIYRKRGYDMTTEAFLKKPGASIPELATEYGISEALLYSLANRGALPGCRRLGKRFVVHRQTFETWLQTGQGDECNPKG